MKEYTIEITETLQKQVTVEAISKENALKLVKSLYCDCDIVLDENNLIDTSFKIIKKGDE